MERLNSGNCNWIFNTGDYYRADEADKQIADLRAELALCETTHANLNDEYHVLKKKMEEKDRDINHLWQRDSVWRAKKEMLENDLGEAWKRLEAAERERDSLKIVGEEISKQCTILNNKLARYREGWRFLKTYRKWAFSPAPEGVPASKDEAFRKADEAIAEALKAVEGDQGSEAGK